MYASKALEMVREQIASDRVQKVTLMSLDLSRFAPARHSSVYLS